MKMWRRSHTEVILDTLTAILIVIAKVASLAKGFSLRDNKYQRNPALAIETEKNKNWASSFTGLNDVNKCLFFT